MQSLTPLTIAAARTGAVSLPGLVSIETTPARHGTLIASDLIVVASHYLPPLGVAVTSFSSDGERTSVIASVALRQSDVSILRLKYPIEKASIAAIATEEEIRKARAAFVGAGWRNINTSAQESVAAAVTLSLIQTDSADPARKAKIALFKGGASQPRIEDGDSGSPVFVQVGDVWKLAGVWNGNNASFQPASLLFPWKAAISTL